MKTTKVPVVYESTPLTVLPRIPCAGQPTSQTSIDQPILASSSGEAGSTKRIKLDQYFRMSQRLETNGQELNKKRVLVKFRTTQDQNQRKYQSSSSSGETSYEKIEFYLVPSECTRFRSPKMMELNDFVLKNFKNSI